MSFDFGGLIDSFMGGFGGFDDFGFGGFGGGGGGGGGDDIRVRIAPKSQGALPLSGALSPLQSTRGLMFPYTPTITWNNPIQYSTINPVHSNQDYHFYSYTGSATISVSGQFTAQTQEEASYMLAAIHFLRSATKMRFGSSSNPGLPPPVCTLTGYGSGIFNSVNGYISNFTVELPNNVDYVRAYSGPLDAFVPTLTNLTVNFVAQNTPRRNRTFDYNSFASGGQMSQGGWI